MDWPSPTLPLIMIAFKGPAYNDSAKETAALDALAYLAFSRNSELYQKLVVQEQKADALFGNAPRQRRSRVCSKSPRASKRPRTWNTSATRFWPRSKQFQEKPVDAAKLDQVRKRLRYELALRMDNSDTIASMLAQYIALRRTPETMNALYDQYAKLTPEDIRQAAAKYLMENGRTIVTLAGPGGGKVKTAAALLLLTAGCAMRADARGALPGKSPLVNLRIVFTTGAAADPEGKPGLAYLTAQMLAEAARRI